MTLGLGYQGVNGKRRGWAVFRQLVGVWEAGV